MYLDRSGSGAWSWLIDKLSRTPLTVILSTRFLTEVGLVDFWPRKKKQNNVNSFKEPRVLGIFFYAIGAYLGE